jgi:predicted small secreted protein
MLRKIVLTIATLSAIAIAPLTMTGCNTVAGAGKDIERGGEAVHDTAKDAQRKM